MFYWKRNLPKWERAVRIALALILAALAMSYRPTAALAWAAWAAVAAAALTAAIGFCPACALVGRRPVGE